MVFAIAYPANASSGLAKMQFGTGHSPSGAVTHTTSKFHLGQTIYFSASLSSAHSGKFVLRLTAPDKETADFPLSGKSGDIISGHVTFTRRQASGTYQAQIRVGKSAIATGAFTWKN